MTTIQVNERGSLTLPKKLRRALGIEKGGVMVVEPAEGGLLLRPAVAYPIELYTDDRVREFDAADRALKRRLGRRSRA
jgi:AbrB family looped-hinge helix DNA binding protein